MAKHEHESQYGTSATRSNGVFEYSKCFTSPLFMHPAYAHWAYSDTSTALARLALVLFQRLHIACATYDPAASLPVSSSVEELLRKYKAVLT